MKVLPILHIGQFEKETISTEIYSNDLSTHLVTNQHIIHTPHKHDFFLCVLFIKGSGTHEIDFDSYPVGPGSVFFLKPGQTHSWTFDTTPEGFIFFHTQDFYEFHFSNSKLSQFPFYFSHTNPPYLTLNSAETQRIAARFEEINTEYHTQYLYKEQKIANLMNLVYIDLARCYTAVDNTKVISSVSYLHALETLEKTIETHYREEKSASFYANQLHISSKHLNRITKNTVNKTTTEIIIERVMLEAKRLIVHTDSSLSHIGELLGYDDYAYFSKTFKVKTGITPFDFKKKYSVNR